MLEAMRTSSQSLRSIYMGFFRIPRVPEALLGFAGLRPAGLSLRLLGLPRAAWQRDRAQLLRAGGLRGPLNWYRGAITRSTRIRRVSVPAMYIWGRHDPALGRRAAELTAKYVTGPYRFEELKAGHWVPDRNARDLQRILGEHLEDFGVPVQRESPAHASATKSRPGAKRGAPRKATPRRAPAKRAPKPPTAPS
jgi:pimeloyl-ACP methyl ester carboxylesterase